MFLWRNNKNISSFWIKKIALSGTMIFMSKKKKEKKKKSLKTSGTSDHRVHCLHLILQVPAVKMDVQIVGQVCDGVLVSEYMYLG